MSNFKLLEHEHGGELAKNIDFDEIISDFANVKVRSETSISTGDEEQVKRRKKGFVYVDEKYQIGEQLANGGLGTIFEGIRKSDKQRVALKVVEKNGETMILPDEPDPIPLEVGLMKLVSRNPACPHVIQLLDWCETDTHVVLVLERPELCQNLHTFIKQRGRIGEPLARHFCYQLVKALQHCESREVFHRDVKPSNILVLLTTNDIKLIDFGCGDLHEETAYEEFCGTKAYAPPECLKNHGYYSTPTTVWTLGLTLAFIVSGHLPFEPGKNECIFIPSHVSQGKTQGKDTIWRKAKRQKESEKICARIGMKSS
ncbi:PIM2 kinase, partial [Polypterus senegalus]|nr:PIM2 kinase [Polypterus senegalus]